MKTRYEITLYERGVKEALKVELGTQKRASIRRSHSIVEEHMQATETPGRANVHMIYDTAKAKGGVKTVRTLIYQSKWNEAAKTVIGEEL